MKIKIVRIDPSLPLPEYKTEGAVAFDLYTRETVTVQPHTIEYLPSNFIIQVPEGYALIIAARSGTPKKGLVLRNGIGVIDQDYHGAEDELKIMVYNFTEQAVTVERGNRVAQGLIIPIERAEWEEASGNLKEDSRGGFGTTG